MKTIQSKLTQSFRPSHLEVINESHMHSVAPGSETHFKVVIVSDLFERKKLLERHRLLNITLGMELQGGVHALSLHAYTPKEWEEKGRQSRQSPACHGGSKADR